MDTPLVPHREPDPPIGRTREIEYLTGVLDAVERGERRAAMVVGTAGIGKTTLLRSVRSKCKERKMILIYVRAPAAAGLPPLFPIGEVVAGLNRGCEAAVVEAPEVAVRMESALESSGTTTFPIGIPQLAQAFDEVSMRCRIAVLFDDYQWAPQEGASLLFAVLKVVEQPVFFVGTARLESQHDGAPRQLPESSGDLIIDHLSLKGLEPAFTQELLEGLLGTYVLPSLASTVHSHSQGNPLFTIELANRWRLDGAIERLGAYWALRPGSDHPVPGSLTEMVSARLERMDENCRHVASVLTLLGRDASFSELRSITGLESQDLVGAISRLVRRGVLHEEGHPPRYSLSNPLYGAGVRALLRPTDESLIHQSIYRALLGREPSVTCSELAHHAVRALEEPSELQNLLVEAADEADRVGSYEEAAAWYERLAAVDRHDGKGNGERLNRWAKALSHFDPLRAVEVFSSCLSETDSEQQRVIALRGRAQALRFLGRLDEAQRDLEVAYRVAEPTEHYEIKHLIAVNHGIRGNLDEAEYILRELQEQKAAPTQNAMVAGDLAMIAFARGRLEESNRRWSEAHDMCDEYSVRIRATQNLIWGHLLVGHWTLARQEIDAAIEASQKMGDAWNLFSLFTDAARLNAWQGRFPEAFDFCARASSLAARLGSPVSEIECLDAWGTVYFESRKFRLALEAFRKAGGLIRDTTEKRESASTLAHLAESFIAVGDFKTASEIVQEARACLIYSPIWSCAVERVDAQCLTAVGKMTGALEKLLPLIERGFALPFEQAKTRLALARVFVSLGNKPSAASELVAAGETLKALGSSHLVLEVEDLLRSISPKPRGRPKLRDRFDFTSRELDVLRLLGAGKSDADIGRNLFISARTASKHVQNMLSKTGLSRRAELIAFAIREGLA
jgi:DNA-binding CsgD family transcriptional regulator/tetratricopeptide (TPR) repeat protein